MHCPKCNSKEIDTEVRESYKENLLEVWATCKHCGAEFYAFVSLDEMTEDEEVEE